MSIRENLVWNSHRSKNCARLLKSLVVLSVFAAIVVVPTICPGTKSTAPPPTLIAVSRCQISAVD
jgi:hypothetical protein